MKLNVYKESHKRSELDLGEQVQGSPGPLNFLIGRDEQCPIFLDDPRVSREHAVIIYQQQKWLLQAQAAIAPTFLNGNKIKEAELHHGDQIQIGPFTLTVAIEQTVTTDYDIKKTIHADASGTDLQGPAVSSAPATAADSDGVLAAEAGEGDLPALDAASDNPKRANHGVQQEAVTAEGDLAADENADDNASSNMESDSKADDLFGEGHLASEVQDSSSADSSSSALDGDVFGNDDGHHESEDQNALSSDGDLGDAAGQENQGTNFFGEQDFNAPTDSESGGGDLINAEKTMASPTFVDCYLEIQGNFAPYDHFQISTPEVYIGRDSQQCQIILGEDAVSAKHAVIKKSNVSLMIEDLNSANGTLLNGRRINQAPLADGDEFEIGSTKFKVHIESKFLDQELGRLMPVEAQQVKEVEEVVELSSDFNEEGAAASEESFDFKTAFKKNPRQALLQFWRTMPVKRKVIYGVVVALVILLTMPDQKNSTTSPSGDNAITEENAAAEAEAADLLKFTEEELSILGPSYLLAKELFDQGKYREAMLELEKILPILGRDRDYKQSKQLYDLAKQGLERLEELERKRQAEEEKRLREEKVATLVQKAQAAVQERNSTLAHALFDQIIQLNPENFEVPILKAEIEAWENEQARLALEKAEKEAERKRQVDALAPGKALYLQKEWYKAINSLQDFLKGKNLDEDLIKEASDMLARAKEELDTIVRPLLEKAQALVDGQDLKGAYEIFGEVLRYDPGQTIAVSQMAEIREKLDLRSRDVYRDALISESLNLFDDAKQKFQEVQQISPSDSSYYMKASRKLEHYAE
ncbi:MAG: FHA domain-containing protein [Bacteriovoracaceae bacterium]|nr:FHA domain-containing protein [Bacteriovoracaceae bacterium]